jgi:hypothetical protein
MINGTGSGRSKNLRIRNTVYKISSSRSKISVLVSNVTLDPAVRKLFVFVCRGEGGGQSTYSRVSINSFTRNML